MTQRPVLVLGAGSDIGMALAHAYAATGRPVQLAARRPESLETARKDMEIRHKVSVTSHAFDALDLDGMDAFYDGLPDLPGIVVSVVGLLGDQAETEGNPENIRAIVDSNFTGPALALELAAKRLATLDEDTAVIGVGSVAGDRGRAKNYWYGAAKAGLAAVLSGLRQKHVNSRVLVMTVKPGFVATRMTECMDLPGPLVSQPEDMARLILRAEENRRPVVYHWKWWIVMTIIKHVPEFMFRKMKF